MSFDLGEPDEFYTTTHSIEEYGWVKVESGRTYDTWQNPKSGLIQLVPKGMIPQVTIRRRR